MDGKEVASVPLPDEKELAAPVTVDLSSYLSSGEHRVEIRRGASASRASAQLVTGYYLPWAHTSLTSALQQDTGNAEALRLAVRFDSSEAMLRDKIQCTVEAERIGFRGYGMMLAEIGLPPGADVDRASLERAMKESGWEINRYDLLPDRLICTCGRVPAASNSRSISLRASA